MDKNKIMEYLYGEMDASEMHAFEAKIKEDPKLREEVEQLRGLQSFMSDHEDELPSGRALILPPKHRSIWKSKWWAVAASLIVLLAAGKMLDVRVVAGNGQLAIQYGDNHDSQVEKEYKELLHQLASNIDLLRNDVANRLDANQKMIEANANHIDQYQGEMKNMVSEMTNDQRKMTKDLWQEFKDDQKQHTDLLVDDFVEYVDLQRQHDLQLINESINTLAQIMQMENEQRAQYVYQPVQK